MVTINSQLLMPSLWDLNSLILILEKVDGGEPTLELLKILLKSEFSTEETAVVVDLEELKFG